MINFLTLENLSILPRMKVSCVWARRVFSMDFGTFEFQMYSEIKAKRLKSFALSWKNYSESLKEREWNDENYSWKVQSEFLTFHVHFISLRLPLSTVFYEKNSLLLFGISTRSVAASGSM